MKYHLEVVERITKKHNYSYERRAAPVLHTWRWKQVAVCNVLEPLMEIAKTGKNCRIIDSETGAEVYKTRCPDIY